MKLLNDRREIMSLSEIIKSYIIDKKINIPEKDWTKIKEGYNKEEVITTLATIISNGCIEMPLAEISLEEALLAEKELSEQEFSIKEGEFYTRYEDSSILSGFYFDESNKYNVASNYFHQYNRFMCDSINSPSPYRVFHNEKFAKSMCGALYSLKCKKVDMQTLYSCLSLRKYVASQFKPSVAKAIYDYYKATNIVDLCSGWGDRLAGFYASKYGKSYFGIDANKSLQEGYKKQIEEYSKLFPTKHATVIYGATEDEEIVLPECDFIFTSPPYFGIEKYSKDDKQSYLRYRKIDKWLEGFLFPVIQKSYDALIDGGYLALNISDVYMHHQVNEICKPMVEYAQSIGFKLDAVHGMKMAKRINSKSDKKGIFCEPIYVFKK